MVRRWPWLVLAFGLIVVLVSCAGRGGLSISVSPGEVTLAPGELVVFTAVVMGGAGTGVEWSSSGGLLVPSGLTAVFTAPDEMGEYTVTARSARDRGRWATAVVTVAGDADVFVDVPVADVPGASSDALVVALPDGSEMVLEGRSVRLPVKAQELGTSGFVAVFDPGLQAGWFAMYPMWFTSASAGSAVVEVLDAGSWGGQEIGPHSTAVLLLQMTPALFHASDELRQLVSDVIRELPEVVALGDFLAANFNGGDYVEASGYESVFAAALDAAIAAVDGMLVEAQGGQEDSDAHRSSVSVRRAVSQTAALRTSAVGDAVRLAWDVSGVEQSIPWVGRAFQLDTSGFETFDAFSEHVRENGGAWALPEDVPFTSLDPVDSYLLREGLGFWKFFDLISFSAGLLTSPLQLESAPDMGEAGAYYLQAFSCGMGTFAADDQRIDEAFIALFPDAHRARVRACAVLHLTSALNLVGVVTGSADFNSLRDSATFSDLWQSIVEAVVDAYADDGAFSQQEMLGIATHTMSAVLAIVTDQALESGARASAEILGRNLASNLLVVVRFSATASKLAQLSAAAVGRNRFTAYESAIVVVGDPFGGAVPTYELTVTPGGLSGSAPVGGADENAFELANTGSGAVRVDSMTVDASWLALSPTSIANLDAGEAVTIAVEMSAEGMSAGTYDGAITIAWSAVGDENVAGSAPILVTFAVTPPAGGADFEPAPSYISITNVSLGAASGGTRPVTFDISWDESWRGPDRPTWVEAPDNWDAAWVFVKYRVDGGAWQHATLAGSGHVQPSGSVVSVPSDRVGATVYRSSSGYGTFTANGVSLQWDYVADGVAAGASVEVRPFGIEMVYVPQESFSVGSGGSNAGEFRAGGTNNTPFVVSSPSSVSLGNGSGQLMWTEGPWEGSPSGSTSALFPTGFGAFYVMKYQVTQGQYVDFLNTLTQAQADARKHTEDRWRYAITGSSVGSYATSLPFVAMNYLSWADGAAFADWAGLRPVTELEFEKAARGPVAPVANEFAWGSTSITQATGLANAGTIAETPTPAGANAAYDGAPGVQGPVRVGSFAVPGRLRRDAGAGYYGALELSGNLYERPVTVGNAEGRAFTGAHGDGTLDGSGNANVASWPGSTALGAGFRSGGWASFGDADLRVSYRGVAAITSVGRSSSYGWRGARSAP